MPLKVFLVVAALAAVLVGLILPTPHRRPDVQAQSQIPTIEVGPG
jgi:hypothetical protein